MVVCFRGCFYFLLHCFAFMSQSAFGSNGLNTNLRVLINIFCKKRDGSRVCHINAQSLFCKIDELFVDSDVDVVCVSETWFKPNVQNVIYDMSGFRLFRGDRYNNICSFKY